MFRPIIFLMAAAANVPVLAQTHPTEELAGRWYSDIQMTSRVTDKQNGNYFWVGAISGDIMKTGRISMRSRNKCALDGLITPRTTPSRGFTGIMNATGCEATDMNRQYNADFTFAKGNLTMKLTSKRFTSGRLTGNYEMLTTLSRN